MYLGFRNKDFVILEEEYKKVSDKFIITTDDGTYGHKGFAINFLEEDLKSRRNRWYICLRTTTYVKSS